MVLFLLIQSLVNLGPQCSTHFAVEWRDRFRRPPDDFMAIQAYGWSLPAVLDKSNSSAMVPVPVCCRPLMENQPSIKVSIRALADIDRTCDLIDIVTHVCRYSLW